MKDLVNKTIKHVEFLDTYDKGLRLYFTDGSSLHVAERMQAGELRVLFKDEFGDVIEPQSDHDIELDNEEV